MEKLDRQVRKGLQSEAEVVYLLVQTRKLLEIDQRKREFKALVFHCDWVVHARLSGPTPRHYLSLINAMQHVNVTGAPQPELLEEFARLISARAFREELRTVLASEGISPTLCDPLGWKGFMSLYGDVISDVPLTITRSREAGTARLQNDVPTYIDSFTIQKRDLDPENHLGAAFELEWNLHFASEPERYKMAGWRLGFHPNA